MRQMRLTSVFPISAIPIMTPNSGMPSASKAEITVCAVMGQSVVQTQGMPNGAH